jgi:nucleotidyltransferase AbiEii toxin of type IV toxin-antitoxin system
MPVSEFHREIASIALRAAAGHGFALAGGNALIAHGIVDRPTEDVDLFTDQDDGVATAAGAVQDALRGAGFGVERLDQAGDLGEVFEGMGDGLAEWIVTAPGGREMLLQMAYFDRDRVPVIMDFGPVLDLEDVVGGKVCALASRVEPRDFVDTAAALGRYTVSQLIGFAQRLDPGLTRQDFTDAGRMLDQLADQVFLRYGLTEADVTSLRQVMAAWPRH